MKIAIIGAAGVRTPLIIQAMATRQSRLGLVELVLMDIDGERLDLIGALTPPTEFKINRTTNARAALEGADYVITTFRVGGIDSRVVDERIPLNHNVLGQETTGAGGFAMGMRSIPVLLDYVELMRQHCPEAWLINFANPAGMLTEALVNVANWKRAVGICDAPSTIWRVAAAVIGAPPDQVLLDYFGLNHLGWVRSVIYHGQDYLPRFIALLQETELPYLPFEPGLIAALGLIPNEYLYYYYQNRRSVQNILASGQSRGEQIAELNLKFFAELRQLKAQGDKAGMNAAYQAYLEQRGGSYMVRETGHTHDLGMLDSRIGEAIAGEGYAGVALDLIEALSGSRPKTMILNVPNLGAIQDMDAGDVVEVTAHVSHDLIHPLVAGKIPDHCLGLMKQVKAYERLTISAAVEQSYAKALTALALHPLVQDYTLARAILEGYIQGHGSFFPQLN